MSEVESDAMWKLYVKGEQGIAIRSTAHRFDTSISDAERNQVHLGVVRYVDYASDVIPEGDTVMPFMFKRRHFEYEREFRALIQHLPVREGRLDWSSPPDADIKLSINLDELISVLVVPPGASAAFADTVRSLSRKYGVEKPILRSELDAQPFS
jgi:hypothetical protein